MKKLLFLVLFLLLGNLSISQQITLSENAEISIITVGSGENLVDTFGHSAIRVKDDASGIDYAYNYGTYDFDAPNFYGNFARGKLLYILGVNRFHNFLRFYINQNRSVKEQVLNLSQSEKQDFFNYLQNNQKPENRGYLYDFFYDNCATKLRDVSQDVLKSKVTFDYSFANQHNYTLRGLIHKHTEAQPWGELGIDLALGAIIDRKAKPEEYIFLPEYIYKAFNVAKIENNGTIKPLVKKNNILYKSKPRAFSFIYGPIALFYLLALLVIYITYKDLRKPKRSKWLDFIIFFITGLLGVFMLLLWFATDHTATVKNYNIFWAFAPNVFIAFSLLKKELKPWLKKYLAILLILLVVTLLVWILKIQVFNIVVLPILIILFVRYVFLMKRVKG